MDAMAIIFQGISFVNFTGDSSNLSLSIISIMKKKKQEINIERLQKYQTAVLY